MLNAARVEVPQRTTAVTAATGITRTDIHGIGPLTAAPVAFGGAPDSYDVNSG